MIRTSRPRLLSSPQSRRDRSQRPRAIETLESRRLLAGGPRVVDQTPTTLAAEVASLDTIRVRFDVALDATTFTAADVLLKNPQGLPVDQVQVHEVAGSGDTEFDLKFPPQTVRGSYPLTIGPDIRDRAGNLMNHDNDASPGEDTDAYSGTVVFNELLALALSLDKVAIDETSIGGLATLTIHRNGSLAESLMVELNTSDSTELMLSQAVEIPSGKADVAVEVRTINDPWLDGERAVTIGVHAQGYDSNRVDLTVIDDDQPARQTLGGPFAEPLPAGTYYVVTDWIIPETGSAVVDPGTTLLFDKATALDIRGTFSAKGTSAQPILFTSSVPDPKPGDWKGITTQSSVNPHVMLDGVTVTSAQTGFWTYGTGSISVTNSEIRDSSAYGIEVHGVRDGRSSPQMVNSKVHGSGQAGIFVRASSSGGPRSGVVGSAIIRRCEIYDNAEAGILVVATYGPGAGFANGAWASAMADANRIHHNKHGIIVLAHDPNGTFGSAWAGGDFTNNVIFGNEDRGIDAESYRDGLLGPLFANNTIVDNGGSGIRHWRNSAVINNNVVRNRRGIEYADDEMLSGRIAHNNVFNNTGIGLTTHQSTALKRR